MSRWIALGLRRGTLTTGFPRRADAGAPPAAVAVRAEALTAEQAVRASDLCPTGAIQVEGDAAAGALRVDMGRCVMCGRCVRALPEAFSYSTAPEVAVRSRERLMLRVAWSRGGDPQPEAVEAAEKLQRRSLALFRHSLHIRHVDAGSCNGCESELQMLGSPVYDLHRLGLFFTPTPRHADCLLVTGVVTRQMEQPLRDTYDAMPEPKLVVAAGACAIGGGAFEGGITVRGPLDHVLPVDVYVPGCPPSPLALLHALLLAVGRAQERYSPAGPDGS